MKINKMKHNFENILKDFSQPSENFNFGIFNGLSPYKLKQDVYLEPHLIYLIFVELKSFIHRGKGEKVLWEIPIHYKNEPLLFVHGKFGLSIYHEFSKDNQNEKILIVEEAIDKIRKVVPYLETFLESKIEKKVNDGKITILNFYPRLNDRYSFFRIKAKEYFKKTNRISSKENISTRDINNRIRYNHIAEYYSYAMTDTFFSILEHILVLIIPFSKTQITLDNLSEFIMLSWSKKFTKIFEVKSDKVIEKIYNELLSIKEIYRNPLSHGYFEKNNASIYIHWEEIGAIPMQLNKDIMYHQYLLCTIDKVSYDDICQTFDDFMRYLSISSYRYGLRYIEASLNVAFDDKSKKKYNDAMKSDEEFEKLIDSHIYLLEQNMNMDW